MTPDDRVLDGAGVAVGDFNRSLPEDRPEVRLDDGERRLLASGLRRVAARVPRDGRALLVSIVTIRFNECDYQAEGLEAAIMAWTAVELGFDPPVVRVAFDRAANRYRFDFG